jgi:hypothetical protein
MLEKKYINKQQADDLLGKPKIPDIKKYVNPERIDIAEIFDANFTNSSQKQTSYILKEPKYHKEFKELIIKDNGQIDMSKAAPIIDGTIKVEKVDGNVVITIDGKDDAGNDIKGRFAGTVSELENQGTVVK